MGMPPAGGEREQSLECRRCIEGMDVKLARPLIGMKEGKNFTVET